MGRFRTALLAGAAAVACSLFSVGVAVSCAAEPGNRRPPNIIFLMADDMGPHDLGCYGQQRIHTPHIDRMASEGVRFTHCYAGATVCAPSRCVLMTGLHTGHAHVRDNFNAVAGGIGPQKRLPLRDEDVTVAEVLKSAGYVTGITGKWGLGEPDTPGLPNLQGFDDWFGYLNQREAHGYYPEFLWRNMEQVRLEGNRDGGRGEYSHDLFSNFAVDFVHQHRDHPFFLYVAWCTPHVRFEVPDLGEYEQVQWGSEDAAIYAAMVTRMDRDVGRILDAVKQAGLDDRTLVCFCSDNGGPYRWEGIFDSNQPFRGTKEELYEGGIRTPMIVRWPGSVPAGTVSDQIWSFADVLPTFADVAGTAPPGDIDGVSILPTLLGKEQDLSQRMLYWETYRGEGFQQAARWNNWKAIRLGVGQPLALYDVVSDSGEVSNVAADFPEIVERMDAYLRTARTSSPSWPVRGLD